jgi:hypothetical protein
MEKCLFSHVLEAEVAHIWPHAVNDKVDSCFNTKEVLSRCALLLNPALLTKLNDLLIGQDKLLGLSDLPWNMLTMSRNKHAYWGKALYGLQWHDVVEHEFDLDEDGKEIEYTVFRVQWHWLPKKIADSIQSKLSPHPHKPLPPRRLVRLETAEDITSVANAINESISSPQSLCSPKKATLRDCDGRLIETGRLFTLRVAREDEEKMKTVIDAQWLAIRMAAFSGAAEVADELERHCSPETTWARIMHTQQLNNESAASEN